MDEQLELRISELCQDAFSYHVLLCTISFKSGTRVVSCSRQTECSVQFSQSCPTLCNPMDCSMPGFPVHHQLLELTQTNVHRVGDAIRPSHLLSFPFLPASIFPSIKVFSNELALHIRWPKYWSISFTISPSN